MRELNIGETQVRVRATALALLYYKQEFKSDLIGDLFKMQNIAKDPAQFDSLSCLQLVWAMAKADAYGTQFPSFEAWLASFGNVDFSDPAFLIEALEEASDGFLRRGKSQIGK